MEKRNVLSSPRLNELKKRRRKAIVNKSLVIFFCFAILFAVAAYFSRLDGLNIKAVEASGNKVVDSVLIEDAVNEKISGKYLWLFPKSNVLYYPKSTIKAELQNKFYRLDSIDLSVRNREVLAVSVTEREAKYLWCGATPAIDAKRPEKEKCYFLDSEGYVFDEAPYFSGEVYFKFYGFSDPKSENPAGSYFSQKNFKQLVLFKDVVAGMGIKPVVISVLPDGDIEMFLARTGSNMLGPKIIFRSDAELKNVAENLQAALATDPLMSQFKSKYGALLYIDLRFGNKVYFKFNE